MSKLFIPLVLGSAREGRESEKVARYVFNEITAVNAFETQFVDVRDFLFGKTAEYPEAATPWKEIMTRADGWIIVSPEYNRGIPGELKILIDSLDEEYAKKPVAIVGVSSGKMGGARMAEHILPTLITLGMIPLSPALLFPVVKTLFDSDGNILDDSYKKKIADMVEQMVWYAQALRKS
jgi:NAD(P)H-dependent FMN reductase